MTSTGTSPELPGEKLNKSFDANITIVINTYFTDKEKSPGDDSLILMRKPPSGLFCNSFSASALVILP